MLNMKKFLLMIPAYKWNDKVIIALLKNIK